MGIEKRRKMDDGPLSGEVDILYGMIRISG